MNYDEVATMMEVDIWKQFHAMVILCHRPYDEVTFPETHNAFSTHEDNIFYPASNHRTGFKRNGMLECVLSCSIRII